MLMYLIDCDVRICMYGDWPRRGSRVATQGELLLIETDHGLPASGEI